ncbi:MULTISPECIES: hypothetical protein [Pseudonocardia]|jgi:hypothetical protein|uniref:DUF3784 domain-containing protein n=2 Tax=Pseudonocardia TaxID=1847 RepID=A0ABS9TFE8_9PSEU|nr:hypothetical protein [Pseudonocardia alaniniphila]MCH6167270.1 hypothetical protein [Pseudonocardia alaniniphila]
MGTVFGIVAAVVALVGLLAALGHVGYLAMLNNAAKKRGLSGGTTVDYVNSRWKVAGGTAGVALLGLLMTTSSSVPIDLIGLVLGGGAGLYAKQALDSTRTRFRSLP